jgi:hypothetical protein
MPNDELLAYMLLGLIANIAPNLRDAAQRELCPDTLPPP